MVFFCIEKCSLINIRNLKSFSLIFTQTKAVPWVANRLATYGSTQPVWNYRI